MSTSRTVTLWWLLLSILIFVSLSIYFVFFPPLLQDTTGKPPPDSLDPSWYAVDSARGEYRRNQSISGNCHICHAFWVPIPQSIQTSVPRFAHANIQLDHGNNSRCYNCHHIADRNKFVANDGSPIMTEIPEKLCDRCHGLIYTDWENGTHGKWMGRFIPETPFDQNKLGCTDCHDPHKPAFVYTQLAPSPVWPAKHIRTTGSNGHSGPMANYLISKQPEESF